MQPFSKVIEIGSQKLSFFSIRDKLNPIADNKTISKIGIIKNKECSLKKSKTSGNFFFGCGEKVFF